MGNGEKMLDERCDNCGARLKQYPVKTAGGGRDIAVGCPNFFMNDGCKEVVDR